MQKVFKLTEDFIRDVIGSQEMLDDFKEFQNQGKIIVNDPSEKHGSRYYNGNIYYSFDGTIDSANKLIHEFIHYWIDKKSNPSNDRNDHTMFYEFLSIYYEIVFIKYMADRGLLKKGEVEQLISSRLNSEYSKDRNNMLIMLLELCQRLKNNGEIDKEDIINVLGEHMPNEKNRDNLWESAEMLKEYCKDHIFVKETIAGIIYKLSNALALQTSCNFETAKKISELAFYIKDRGHDDKLIEEYMRITNQTKLQVHPTDDFEQKGSTAAVSSVRDRIMEVLDFFLYIVERGVHK